MGLGGNDVLNGMGGNDRIDGGTGTDTAVIAVPFSTIQGFTLTDGVLTLETAAGTETLVNIERVRLADSMFAFDTHGPAGDAPGGHVWQAAALYRAGFGVLPSQTVLSLWTSQADHLDNMAVLAQNYIDYYAPGISSADLVSHLYGMLVHEVPTLEIVQNFVDRIGPDRQFHTQGELFAYAASLPLNTDQMVEFVASMPRLDPGWF
jgi:hypothetical protein